MLEQKDLQAIGKLLDEKLDERDKRLDERFDEMIGIVNEGFTGIQEQIDGLKSEMAKRPTRTEL